MATNKMNAIFNCRADINTTFEFLEKLAEDLEKQGVTITLNNAASLCIDPETKMLAFHSDIMIEIKNQTKTPDPKSLLSIHDQIKVRLLEL